jgi:hypothetical protein
MRSNLVLHETLGMTMADAVDRLGIRPLCFGAAWKVLDLLVESAFSQAGHQPRGRRWLISDKVSLARTGTGSAQPLSSDADVWERLGMAYANTEQVRHSLVHRRASVGSDGAITGVDERNRSLRPLTAEEQEDFCRASLLAAGVVTSGKFDPRVRNRLVWHLDRLASVTNLLTVGAYDPAASVPRIEVEVDPEGIDLSMLKGRLRDRFPNSPEIDLILVFSGTEQRAIVYLEDAPDGVVQLDPESLPDWAPTIP